MTLQILGEKSPGSGHIGSAFHCSGSRYFQIFTGISSSFLKPGIPRCLDLALSRGTAPPSERAWRLISLCWDSSNPAPTTYFISKPAKQAPGPGHIPGMEGQAGWESLGNFCSKKPEGASYSHFTPLYQRKGCRQCLMVQRELESKGKVLFSI